MIVYGLESNVPNSSVLVAASNGKEAVTNDELEAALQAAVWISGPCSPNQNSRIAKVMAKLGFTKKRYTFPDGRRWAWVRNTAQVEEVAPEQASDGDADLAAWVKP